MFFIYTTLPLFRESESFFSSLIRFFYFSYSFFTYLIFPVLIDKTCSSSLFFCLQLVFTSLRNRLEFILSHRTDNSMSGNKSLLLTNICFAYRAILSIIATAFALYGRHTGKKPIMRYTVHLEDSIR